jgi:hypothetical protein
MALLRNLTGSDEESNENMLIPIALPKPPGE